MERELKHHWFCMDPFLVALVKIDDTLAEIEKHPGLDSTLTKVDEQLDPNRKPGGVPCNKDVSDDTILPVSNNFCLTIGSLVFLLLLTSSAFASCWKLLPEIFMGLTAFISYVDLVHMGNCVVLSCGHSSARGDAGVPICGFWCHVSGYLQATFQFV